MQLKIEISPDAYNRLVQKRVVPLLTSVQGKTKETFSQKIPFFQTNAFQDYLSSRVLLNNDILLQGCIMASTFVEKMLKAFIVFEDETFSKRIHNCSDLYDRALATESIISTFLSKPFVDFLSKIYSARYYEALESDFNIFISYRRTLAELDYIAFIMFNCLNISYNHSELATNVYKAHYLANDMRLLHNNYILGDLGKTFWIEEFPDKTFQLSLFSKFNNLPVESFKEKVQAFNDGDFGSSGDEFSFIEKEPGLYYPSVNVTAILHKSINKGANKV